MTRAAVILVLAQLLTSAASQRLLTCLADLDADLVSQQDSLAYDLARQVANKRVLHTPAAIVYPRSLQAVQGAVCCSRQAGVAATPRAGGHSYEGELAYAHAPLVYLQLL